MIDRVQKFPEFFAGLAELGCLEESKIYSTDDGFFAAGTTISDILACRGITSVPGRQGDDLECSLFFDDWYLYAVADEESWTYSLFKLREQEYDEVNRLDADGDTPGITISFISMETNILTECLKEPSAENRSRLNIEINRVVADEGEKHSDNLKRYFIRTEALGPYLVAEMYTRYIATLAKDGAIAVPERYKGTYRKRWICGRIPRFIDKVNKAAGKTVCDHEKIYIGSADKLTRQEKQVILATHTGNTSFFSFAAEVQFHAIFLEDWTKFRVPIFNRSPYDSAIRADMSIGDLEFTGPTPYYRPNSRIVKRQYECHKDRY